MEQVSPESVKKAFALFMRLVERTELKKGDDPVLFSGYEDAEVSFILEIFEEESGVMIIRAGDTLYYTPRIGNRFLGFTNEELRNAIGISTNTELYAAYVVMLSIIIKFYNGENYNNKCRTMLRVEELERYITAKLEAVSKLDDCAANDEMLNFNFAAAAKLWLDLPSYDEKIVNYSQSRGTRISYIYRTLRFLKEQGLVNIDRDSEIFTTDKMDALVMGFYPENSRKKEILSFIEGV